jgi:hypothetical protein
MNKRKLATLVAASFAGLMLSSPSFATDAQKSQSTSGDSTSAQTVASSEGGAAAEQKAAASDTSNNSEMKNQAASEKADSSQKADADAKAEYTAAVEKCDAQPTDQRSACVQDAEKAQILAASSSGTPQSRSMERADKNAGEPRESHRTGTSKPSKPDSEEDRATARAQDKAVASADAKTDAQAEYRAAIEKCESQPIAQRSACAQDAEKAQTLDMRQSQDGTSSSGAPRSRSGERADDKAAQSDASSNTAMQNQTDSNTPRQTGATEARVPGPQSAK